ncbi:MAG: division/cell wall cluster transcriptional repressor MraZ [Oscillospiraceae bacterium]
MLMGRFEYSLDAKSRTNFPPKFKAEMGDTLYVTKWFDDCLVVYSQEEWNRLDAKFATMPTVGAKELLRILYGNVTEVTPDKQGRILLPQYLKKHAKIDKDIVIIGARSYAEIWDRATYEKNEQVNDFASIQQKLIDMEF